MYSALQRGECSSNRCQSRQKYRNFAKMTVIFIKTTFSPCAPPTLHPARHHSPWGPRSTLGVSVARACAFMIRAWRDPALGALGGAGLPTPRQGSLLSAPPSRQLFPSKQAVSQPLPRCRCLRTQPRPPSRGAWPWARCHVWQREATAAVLALRNSYSPCMV